MMKFFTKRGSAEIVSIILIIVVLGGLTFAITKGFSSNSRESFKEGMNQQNEDFVDGYNNAIEVPEPTFPGFEN
jgi:hypothetical protein